MVINDDEKQSSDRNANPTSMISGIKLFCNLLDENITYYSNS
jgi:hypothetical protein